MGLGGGVTLLDGLPGMRTGNRSEGTSVCSGHAAGFAVSPAAAGALRLRYCCTTAASALLLHYCCFCFTAVLLLLLLYCFTTAVLVFCGAVGVMRCAAVPTAAHRIMCVAVPTADRLCCGCNCCAPLALNAQATGATMPRRRRAQAESGVGRREGLARSFALRWLTLNRSNCPRRRRRGQAERASLARSLAAQSRARHRAVRRVTN